MISRTLALLVGGLTCAFSQESADPACCRMSVTAVPSSTPPAVLLKVRIANVADTPVTLMCAGPEVDLFLALVSSDGRGVAKTEYGIRLSKKERGGSNRAEELNQGDEFEESLELGKIYELKAGVYLVSVSRNVHIRGATVTLKGRAWLRIP